MSVASSQDGPPHPLTKALQQSQDAWQAVRVAAVPGLIIDSLQDTPTRQGTVDRRITGFHQDDESHWVAELECGHGQHVRHDPPWQVRTWVTTPEGRAGRLGTTLNCVLCDDATQR